MVTGYVCIFLLLAVCYLDDSSASKRYHQPPVLEDDITLGPASTDIPELCVETVGGNANGACCKFPFIYKKKTYTYCTPDHRNRPWCATKSNFGKHKLWGYCKNYADNVNNASSVPVDKYNFAFEMGDGEGGKRWSSDDIRKINQTLNDGFFSPLAASRYRSGSASEGHSCGTVSRVPSHLTFITKYRYYYKYTHAYGIPIISSNNVPARALKRACYVLRFLLADRQILRKYLYWHYGRIGIIGQYEGTVSIPEHRWLGPSWNQRARGLGGTLAVPISTGCEENLLCYRTDRYRREDIFLHEFSHGIQEIAIRGGGIRSYFSRLTAQYNYARSRGLWRSTYAMSTVQEYFAEGTQSYFEVNDYAPRANGVHGPINTRAKLRTYDPALFRLIKEVFPCQNKLHDRCSKGTPPAFKMNCDGTTPTKKKKKKKKEKKKKKKKTTKPTGEYKCANKVKCYNSWRRYCRPGHKWFKYMMENCRTTCRCCDNASPNCDSWKDQGLCKPGQTHYKYMKDNCRKSCKICQK